MNAVESNSMSTIQIITPARRFQQIVLRFPLLGVLLMFPLLSSCSSGDDTQGVNERVINSNDPGLRHTEGVLYLNDSLVNGTLEERYGDGSLKSETPYRNGRIEGVAKEWYQNGQLSEERRYDKGEKNGRHQGWWENGSKRYEYRFIEDRFDGEAREWFADGTPMKIFHYQNGYEEGNQLLYFDDGSIRANYVIRDGRRYGSPGAKPCRPEDSNEEL